MMTVTTGTGNGNGNTMNKSVENTCEDGVGAGDTPSCHHNHCGNHSLLHHHPPHRGDCRREHHPNGKVETGVENGSRREQSRRRQGGICDAIEAQLEHLGKGSTWLGIGMGQLISGVLCVKAYTTVYLVDYYDIRVPNAQNFSFYIVLATIFTTILACRPADRNLFPILKMRGWKYAMLAVIEAEANFLVLKSYQYTTLTSVQLLDCFSIPTVLSLSWLVLRIRFKVPHIIGVSICLLGVCCLVWADIEDGKPLGPGKDRFLGDMLCLSGAFLHGLTSTAQEFVVKTFDVVEFLGMIGLFGSFVSGAQTVLLEYGEVTSIEWAHTTPIYLLIGFATAQVAFYVLACFVMKLSSATALTLFVLTADFYSLIVGIYLFKFKFHALYFLSFVLVMTGVIVFSIKPTVIASHIYRSLTREHTTTLDLEMMASSPSSTGFYPLHEDKHGNHHQQHYHDAEDEVRIGGPGSLLVVDSGSGTSTSSPPGTVETGTDTNDLTVSSGRSPMLSNHNCDVVLQTRLTPTSGGVKKPFLGSNGTYSIPEDVAC